MCVQESPPGRYVLPERYVAQFGQAAYDIMLADGLWHVYPMIGKIAGRVYRLSQH